MAFFLIVPSVMVVSILLIHALAKRLGLKIYYSTLAATAIVSFMIIFAAVILSPVPDKKFLLSLGGLILAMSLVLTLVNNFLIRKQRDEERIFTEQVKAAYAEEIKKDSAKPVVEEVVKPIDKFEWSNDAPAPEEKIDDEPVKKVDEPVEEIKELTENSKPVEDFPLESVFKPLNDVKAEAVAKSLQDKNGAPLEEDKSEENLTLQEAFKSLDETKSEANKKILDKDAAPFEEPKPEENFPLQETFKALDAEKQCVMRNAQCVMNKELEISNEVFKAEITSEPVEEKVPEPVEEKVPEPVEEKIPEPVEEKLPEPVEEKIPEPVVEEKIPEPVEEKIPEPVEEKIPEPVEEKLPEPVEEKLPEPVEEKISEPVEEKIPEPVEEKLPEPVEEKISEPVVDEKIETLDNILDKAYDARANGYIWQASALYKKALERYSDDEYAPFVAIDLGNLYKENALYSKAVKVYEDALKLPAVERNDETKREFANNLEYLRVVRDILSKHQAASTPFAKIPKEILQEIDAQFQKTQLRAV